MISDDLPSLYVFDRWANARIVEACRKLSDEDYRREPAPGWASVHSSMYHLAGAAYLWALRFAGEAPTAFPDPATVADLDAAEKMLDECTAKIEAVLARTPPEELAAVRTFMSIKGEPRHAPFWAALRHVVNHATYHRGQIVSKLKRLGHDAPPTDLFLWATELTEGR